ncbi:MAG: ETC complex I subunit [Rhizobiaceae bacterium]
MKSTVRNNDGNRLPPLQTAGLEKSSQSLQPDPVEIAGCESFPASDPPAWTLGGPERAVSEAKPAKIGGRDAANVIDFLDAVARRRALARETLQNVEVRIYRPAPSVMQSGRARSRHWVLEYLPAAAPTTDYLMGWTGSVDPQQQVSLRFDTCAEAIAYAERQGLRYEIAQPHEHQARPPSYAENFTEAHRDSPPP